ncbi:DUF861 domain-containing protein, partial [Listeria monocytogenes]|nr:DUF861 domain-containing protein [Listeria monocytogenes]
MADISKELIEQLVKQVVLEKMGQSSKHVDPSGILSVKLPVVKVSEEDRLDTGNPSDVVYTKDLVTLEESKRLGFGLMEMKDTTFDWFLDYDEVDYVIEGRLDVVIDGRTVSAGPGEIIFIPKGSQ